jgi:DNA-binding CsgD family transcriptional regulator
VALSRREGELVSLLSQGLKNKEIASQLSIGEGTVKVYLSELFEKVGVKDRFELALYGLKNLTSAQSPADETGHGGRRGPVAGLPTSIMDRTQKRYDPSRPVPLAARDGIVRH